MEYGEEWKAWRRTHYGDGTPRREGDFSDAITQLLSTESGARAVWEADRRYHELVLHLEPSHDAATSQAKLTFNAQPHDLDDGCASWHCAYHDVDERPSRRKGARQCGECWHWFRSGRDVLKQHRKILWSMFRDRPNLVLLMAIWKAKADTIWTCPVCAHDF